jgi:predicted alpha/beta hydrolase
VTEPIETRTADGWRLRGDLHRPSGPPRAVAVLGHAMWVDRRTLDRPAGQGLASTLCARGLAVLSFDLRGHGESGPLPRDGAAFSYDDFVREDVPAVVAAARARYPGLPVTVVGHSLTGHAAMIACGRDPSRAPDAVVGLAANLWLPRFTATALRRQQKLASLLLWAAVSAPLGWFDARRFRLGSGGVPWAYVRQYLRCYRSDRLDSEDGRDDYLAALARVERPVLSIASEGDRLLAHPDDTARFLASMPRARVTRRVVTAADVSPPPDHMGLVLAPDCRPLWEEAADFCLAPD